MWCLESTEDGVTYTLTPGRVHCVSRKVGDIVLANDQSVSRKHAFLRVKTPVTDGVLLWDDSSKYGTYVNEGIDKGTKLDKDAKVTIKDGCRVRFGLQENIWVLKREVPCVCVSKLKSAEKSKMKSIVTKLGGQLVETWTQNSTYLTTSALSLTHVVMCALASGKPIVSPAFWQCYSQMLTGSGEIADPAKFIPPAQDPMLLGKENLCLPNPARKALFKDKIFIFPISKRFKELHDVVIAAGGKALELASCGMSVAEFCEPHVVVLSCAENEQTALYKKVLGKLNEQRRRAVPVEDIALAIWKNSLLVHCNPTFSPSDLLRKPNEASSDQDSASTLVTNTEDIVNAPKRVKLSNKVIPPSVSNTDTSTGDETCSMSMQKTQPLPTPVAEPSRKRSRESTSNSTTWLSSQSLLHDSSASTIKMEPEEEEDMFAPEETSLLINPSTSKEKTNSFRGENKTSLLKDDDGFCLPSPPKRKRKKLVEEDGDAFELPMQPPPSQAATNHDEDDPFGFMELDKSTRSSRRLNKTANLNISEDLFGPTQESSSGTCSSREGKRKDRSDSDSENPPAKRASNASSVTSVHSEPKHVITSTAFMNKSTNPSVKKEEVFNSTEEDELALKLSTKVVVTSLVKPRNVNGKEHNISTNNTSCPQKNFKKFKKVWSGSSSRHQITVHAENEGRRLSSGTNRNTDEEEDEDDPFLGRPAPRRNGNVEEDEDANEFALPTFSQVV